MRTALRTVFAVLVMAATATALAESCTPPRSPGKVMHSLNATRLTCADASAKADATMKLSYGKQPTGYRCAQTTSGRNVRYSCDATDNSGKHYDFSYTVQ